MSSPERSRPLGFTKTHPDELATLFSEASVAYASTRRVGGWAEGDARGGQSISFWEDLGLSVNT